MRTWIFLTIFLLSAVTGLVNEYNLVHFRKSKNELIKCLENTNLSSVLKETVDDAQIRSYTIERLAYLMHEITIPGESIETVASDLINVVKQQSHLLNMQSVAMNHTNDEVEGDFIDVANEISIAASGCTIPTLHNNQTDRLKKAIMSSLHECSDSVNRTSDDESEYPEPPRFVQEIPELAELLNMILVGPIRIMPYPTESDYSRFLMYSKRSLTLIEAALRRMNNAHELFEELWNMWNRRVRLFYIDQNNPSYMLSHYSTNRILVYTDLRIFVRSRHYNDTVRDPPDEIEDFGFEMTRYRALDWSNHTNSRIFSVPTSVSRTKSRYYFKFKLHGFFQRLFFYLESVERGITLKSKPYQWKTLNKELPLRIPFDAGYEAYLESVQRRELNHEFSRNSPIFSSLIRSLEPGEQIDEFDLLMMYWHRLNYVNVATTTTENLASKDQLPRLTVHMMKMHLNRLGLPKNLVFEDEPTDFYETGPSKSRNTTVATANLTITTPSSIDSSSTSSYDELNGSKGQLSSENLISKKQPGSSYNSNNNNPSTSNECENFENLNDIADTFYGYIVDSDDSEGSFFFKNSRIYSKDKYKWKEVFSRY